MMETVEVSKGTYFKVGNISEKISKRMTKTKGNRDIWKSDD